MPSGYSSREDPGQMKKNKQSMADLKLRRLTELNSRLREDLERERIPVSQAAKRYCASLLLPFNFQFAFIFVCSLASLTTSRLSSCIGLLRTVVLTSVPASSPTPTAQKTSWFRLSGVVFQRETTHMLSKLQEVSLQSVWAHYYLGTSMLIRMGF
jgi:GGL domain